MKCYWDSSALVEALGDAGTRERLAQGESITRTHSLAEVFSTLTGGKAGVRVEADEAVRLLSSLSHDLSFVELTAAEALSALRAAKAKGVRGGRVHDYFHAVAAEKSGAKKFLATDRFDFNGLLENCKLELL